MRAIILTTALLVIMAAVLTAADNEPKLTIDLSETRNKGPYGSERVQSGKVTQDLWVSRDGNMRAGGYVQHDRYSGPGGSNRNTHGGFQVSGRF
uniref:Venom glycine-rich peptide Pp23a n=1 Tax=Pristhesancus plagipennis TaxID=1955184 RepID=A0A2K8JLY5_PRIPG|nr:venom glycine-rich peptide Pp23a [Pristhesancus plagipennis]